MHKFFANVLKLYIQNVMKSFIFNGTEAKLSYTGLYNKDRISLFYTNYNKNFRKVQVFIYLLLKWSKTFLKFYKKN